MPLMRRPQHSRRRTWTARTLKFRPSLERLEDRTLPSNGQWLAGFGGISPGSALQEQTQIGQNLLLTSGVADQDVHVVSALDLSGSFVVQTPVDVDQPTLTSELQAVPGFIFAQDFPDQPPGDGGSPLFGSGTT